MEKPYKDFSEFSDDYRYDELTDKLGEGGFGTVYRADDMLRNRQVVVKVAKVPKEEKYSLQHEFQIVKKLPIHKNIVYYESCYRFKMSGLGAYDIAVMDFYPLGNLEIFLTEIKPSAEQFKEIVTEILSGISFLHKNGIIHRDIKPSNILIAEHRGKYIPKIADFGLGKIKESADASYTENSFVGGTINYAAPEQILGTSVRSNVDLWSFGILLYKMCRGRVPFEVSSTDTTGRREQLTHKILNADLPKEINNIEEPYQQIIRRCLVTDNEKRVKAADELIHILQHHTVTPEKTEIYDVVFNTSSKRPANLPKSDNNFIYGILALTMGALMVLAVLYFFNRKGNDDKNAGVNTESKNDALNPTVKSKEKQQKPKPEPIPDESADSQVTTEPPEVLVVPELSIPTKKAEDKRNKKKKDNSGGFIEDYELKKPKE